MTRMNIILRNYSNKTDQCGEITGSFRNLQIQKEPVILAFNIIQGLQLKGKDKTQFEPLHKGKMQQYLL